MLKKSIKELKDKEKKVDIEVKIIYDQGEVKELPDKKTQKVNKIKAVLVADKNSEKGDGGPTAFLDLRNEQIDKFKFMDIIKVTDAYTKLVQNGSGQFRITWANEIELIERADWQKEKEEKEAESKEE